MLAAVCLYACLSQVSAATYYVDSIDGDDGNTGLSVNAAWKTLERINAGRLYPGDTVLLRRNRHWRGTLVVPGSGTPDKPLTFSAYADGANPVILRTRTFSQWRLAKDKSGNSISAKIWVGELPGLKNAWGMTRQRQRVPAYPQHQDVSIAEMEEGHFFAPLNRGRFYFRYDAGNPGSVEIGAVQEGILVKDRAHIVIDQIDVSGPGGRRTPGGSTGFKAVRISGTSEDITLQNMTVTQGNSIGVSADVTTRDISYLNLDVHDNAGTGIYMNARSGTIRHCRSYHNGRLETDRGDRGGIGSYRGSHITIEANEVFGNGPDNGSADFEISMVATGPVQLLRNYVHDCAQGCIQIAEGGDNSTIAYNVISRYGSVTAKFPSTGNLSGIRIGGGKSGARDVEIYNNVIQGGRQPRNARDAALYVSWFDNSGLKVKNNIFADNLNKHIYVRRNAKLTGAQFSNNLFSSVSGTLDWKEVGVRDLAHWRSYTGTGDNSLVGDPLFVNASGAFRSASDFALQAASPAIDAGVFVGITRDYNDTSVPYGRSPDIGAFETRTEH